MESEHGCPYGSHRAVEPPGSLPQAAWRLDATSPLRDNEILIRVSRLNVDSASFTQIRAQAGYDFARIAATIRQIVAERGKLHNPVTGSGGMLIGTVERMGGSLAQKIRLNVGDRIATLVSLSLTPLVLHSIDNIDILTDQVDVDGHAILFETGAWALLPHDLPEKLALAVLDVAGAPAQTARLVKPGDTVLVVGAGGKAGLLCLHEARKRVGPDGRVVAMEMSSQGRQRIRALALADEVVEADATRALDALAKFEQATGGRHADVTINVVNVTGTEMASVLCTRERGIVYFFSMATSFAAAALGAEGIARDVDMMIGNGYAAGHADAAMGVVRENAGLRQLFEQVYA